MTRVVTAGSWSYLITSSLRPDPLDPIRDVHAGLRRVPAEIAAGIAEHSSDESLSARELDVLRSVAAGNANKRVAAGLGIPRKPSRHT